MTTPPEGAGMPERVWLTRRPGEWIGYPPAPNQGEPCYVPESRAIAAESRLAALEAERDKLREKLREAERELAIAGVRGSPPPWGDTTIGTLNTRITALRAERDALVPLAREYVRGIELTGAVMGLEYVLGIYGHTVEQFTAARAVLGKEGT